MTAILNALMALDQSLENLELAARGQEQKAIRVQQQDLFNNSSAKTNGNGNGRHLGIDPALVAGKLDSAISRMEQLLREG